MNYAVKSLFFALITVMWLALLPAAQAQTPSSGFNFLDPPGSETPASQSHADGFFDDSTMDIFLGYIGASVVMDWVDAANSRNDAPVTGAASINANSSLSAFSVGSLSNSQYKLGSLPAAVPELSSNISMGILLILGFGGMAFNSRRAKRVK